MSETAAWDDELATVERDGAVGEPMVRQAVRWLAGRRPLGGSRVLDVGAGLGNATVLLAEEFAASEVIAVDPTARFTARAAARFAERGLGDRVRAEPGAIGGQELAGLAPADVVWCAHVVHHLPDPVAALRELASLLVPGSGVLAVAEGGLPSRFLPGGYGVGHPSFVNRLEATLSDHFAGSWSLTDAAVGGGRDWPLLFADAGLRHSESRTFLLDLPAPVSDEVRAHVVGRFTRIQRLIGEKLRAEDAAALARLLDPGDPLALANRPDLFVLQATTWHLGTTA
ncbi:class I SAM-dependent methyltransferase [Amycolatopsis sp. YIM 10]|uniref:class I SAM-dependent methyltransferase n=1 Tax=Amycolatopsis sp. YIM 10 TaxID=2653857 RepID=UPI00129028BA|nr:methyltransferase [Amycolatopsis sp. YIM 10]QFU91836.1 hypothetical protein YIM_33375 [Amycolatopsis sp. YIM 10]